ncbi:MAG: hypothetical protein A3F31_04580 [Candidatus Levybacteria bacterium RIFCSPHIGHO2_12_FULL_38_12]|nr:MAG: hypothetical protein A3D75_01325 [Candidatus Levybacteria bacterium RIFCSPHIGHO2_02_FULL_37_18]OGH22529.1 MAG: hypothetical protein A3F31_04580 [Candidatus Levybacteria bacterium RIFCSPHIGHO2_12_FULL_38_12]OGH33435.1 MAG: hypothetical protein A3A47_04275 [Candidatus Levybacteria bacterium RIFCSPLOWO2_01_FULL_37_20]OGH44066.1 MAG: hypothetical protein A3J14_04950 [Candidatus Levybacteria bacterium RIFCSPLOWO2_02_FULL_37_18]OGH50445.1 MAG: hypothetical protein A3G13_01405 [Candidatus Levy
MNTLFNLLTIVYFVWIVRNILFWVSLWQIKEYRLDRLIVFLKETIQGRYLFTSIGSILKWLAIALYFLTIHRVYLASLLEYFVFLIYLFHSIKVLQELFGRALKRPVVTLKSFVLVILSFSVIVLLLFVPLSDKFLWLLFIDKITFAIVAFFIFFFSFPSELYRDFRIKRAVLKLQAHKKLLVIGVTGSYGKSSTKEFIAQILKKKFKILYTQKTDNTPIGIANTIHKGLDKNIEIFIVEMGAYKKGEISQICDIVRPKIGVLTGINNQHLSLFGNLINTMDTKYELIDSLPKNGLGFFNANNEYVRKLLHRVTPESKKMKVFYRTEDSASLFQKDSSSIVAYNVSHGKTFVVFDVQIYSVERGYKKRITNLRANVIGRHNIENILPGIFIADYLGLPSSEIRDAVFSLVGLSSKMTITRDVRGIICIDDTHNSNPEGILAILKYVKHYKSDSYYKTQKKIFVLQPMIELGKNASEDHYRIAQEIGRVCDMLFLTNENYYNSIVRGVEDSGGKCIVAVGDPSEIIEFIDKNLEKEDIVVFEGRESSNAFKKLVRK